MYSAFEEFKERFLRHFRSIYDSEESCRYISLLRARSSPCFKYKDPESLALHVFPVMNID